jgi:hypothetical protein
VIEEDGYGERDVGGENKRYEKKIEIQKARYEKEVQAPSRRYLQDKVQVTRSLDNNALQGTVP